MQWTLDTSPPEESNWQGLSKSLFWVWRRSIVMLIVLSLACSAAVVLSWKSRAEGFPRTYLGGRAGRRLIWAKAGGASLPSLLPPAHISLPLAREPFEHLQGLPGGLSQNTSWLQTAQPGQLPSCGCLGWPWACHGKGSEPRQDWLGLPHSAGLGGWLWHLGALPPFPSHSHHQWWCSSLPHGVLPIPSTPLMLSVLHNTFLALTVPERISRGFFESLRLSLTNVDLVLA